MAMPLSEAARLLDVQSTHADVCFEGVSTDTRTLQRGNLFVALKGPNFDGHRFIEQASAQGAVAATVQRRVETDLPQLEVVDTTKALGVLAAGWRARFQIPLIAVTGSNGKTTVKEMIAAILSRSDKTLVTKGNLNNEIGVPQTLFRLSSEHRYAVVEMGANHLEEIAYLTNLVRPTVGLVNNAAPAHLEGFKTLQGVAKAKGELFEGLSPDATCIVNSDDEFSSYWMSLVQSREVLRFGLDARADVTATWAPSESGSAVELSTPCGNISLKLPLPGHHNVMNALAASAAAIAVGVSVEQIAEGLTRVTPAQGRWEVLAGLNGAEIINDSYNANPGSLQAGLEVLASSNRQCWLVLGDMGELGSDSIRLHQKMGSLAKRSGVQQLYSIGALASEAAIAFGEGAQSFRYY